jgi:hypothetical protein
MVSKTFKIVIKLTPEVWHFFAAIFDRSEELQSSTKQITVRKHHGFMENLGVGNRRLQRAQLSLEIYAAV